MYCVVFITAKDMDEANRISDKLLKENLVACINKIKDVESLFIWEAKIQSEDEVLLIAKSKRSFV